MRDAPTFGRYAEIPVDRMTPEQREGYRFLVEGLRGRLPGPYKVWVHNPKLVHAAAPFGQHFTLGQSSLPEREIAVLVITSRWHSAYPTAAHEKRGVEVGLPAAAVEAIVAGLGTSFPDAREQVVYEVAMALAGGRLVPQGLYHHVWSKGDVLVIDDRATMHRAHGDYDRSQSRVLWRIIVEGDRPRLV